jgi:putative sterol carrier protein
MSQVSDFFAKVPGSINKDKAAGMNATYQFNIEGAEGGKWAVNIANGEATVTEGQADSPNITLTMTDENFVNLVTGKLNGQTAFLTGKLKIQGDMTLAMKLGSVFNLAG